MIDLIVYEIATGRVARQITVFDEYERDQNLREGEAYLLGSVNPATCYVRNGEVKSYPEKPSDFMTFDFETEEWVDARGEGEITLHLNEAKQDRIFLINEKIGRVRQNFITSLPGQDMIYLRKEQEARAYLLDEDPIMTNYPMLSAEVGVTAETAYQIAQIWLYMSNSWQVIAAQLEGLRLVAINSVTSAANEEAVQLAYNAFEIALAASFAPSGV